MLSAAVTSNWFAGYGALADVGGTIIPVVRSVVAWHVTLSAETGETQCRAVSTTFGRISEPVQMLEPPRERRTMPSTFRRVVSSSPPVIDAAERAVGSPSWAQRASII